MSKFRSYFSKTNTLIEDNLTNNSQNPVTEISYGTISGLVSRFIFDLNLDDLRAKIANGGITQDNITKHFLHLTNTIAFRSDLLGDKMVDQETERAASFTLEFFTITEDWDEGNGYDFVYIDEEFPTSNFITTLIETGDTKEIQYHFNTINYSGQSSNWTYRQTGIPWSEEGALITGGTTGGTGATSVILGTLEFGKGNEDIDLDITDYVNNLLTGGTGVTSVNFGIGVRFVSDIELLPTQYRKAVAFHTKHTHTFYEPYIETTFEDTIMDDRNYFFMDRDNDIYLYSSVGGVLTDDLIINSVTINDYEGVVHSIITGTTGTTGNSIVRVRKGVYKVTVNIDSAVYPDAVLFEDVWNITQNGQIKDVTQEFYLISPDNYYNFDLSNRIDANNYFFKFYGIKYGEKLRRGDNRRVLVEVKELYPNQDAHTAIDIEYRIYTTQTDNHQNDIIPYTRVDRTLRGFEFMIDTSWLIPQDYIIELRMDNGNIYETKQPLNFTIVSDEIYTP